MRLTQSDQQKIKTLIGNINKFSTKNIGVISGTTTGFESSLLSLRKATATFSQAANSGQLTESIIDDLEANIQAVVTSSAASMHTSTKVALINPDEIDGVLEFLDSLRDKVK